MLRLCSAMLVVIALFGTASGNENKIWQAPSLMEELPPCTVDSLADAGIAFISRKELQQFGANDPFKDMLKEDKTFARNYGRVMAAARRDGLLSSDMIKIARGLVHTTPMTKRADNTAGSETWRNLYLGIKHFVKGPVLV